MAVKIMIYSALAIGVAVSPVARSAEQELTKSITLQQCLEQALAGSLDLKIERISPRIEHWGIVREEAAFEPAAVGQFNYQNSQQPLDPITAASLTNHPLSMKQRTLSLSPALEGKLPTGTQYGLSANANRYAGDYVSSNFLYTGGTVLTLTQPLLKNFGFDANLAGLRVARKNREIAVLGLTLKVMGVVSDVSTAYYELLFAIENQKARVDALRSAEKLLNENRSLAKQGLLSPLEVTQAEAGAAERQDAVIVAEVEIKERTLALRLLMGEDVAATGAATLLPVDAPQTAPVALDQTASIQTALELRPDYLQAKRAVEQQGILVRYNRRQLWPQVDLQASYGLNGETHAFHSMVDDVVSANHPSWTVGAVVVVPLGNRAARANYESAKLDQERTLLNLKRQEQVVVSEVINAIAEARAGLQRIAATQVAQRLAEESLRAEQKKMHEGLSTSFLVLQAQAQLTAAHSTGIRARTSYNQALINLARAEGTILRQRGIVVDEK